MTWDQINDWFDAFYEEYIEGKKPIRGQTFSGGRIEIWGRNEAVVVLHDPYPRGISETARHVDMVKNIVGVNHQSIHAEIDFERFKSIVSGEKPLTDSDWTWPDEE
jgi:hypothetical protein